MNEACAAVGYFVGVSPFFPRTACDSQLYRGWNFWTTLESECKFRDFPPFNWVSAHNAQMCFHALFSLHWFQSPLWPVHAPFPSLTTTHQNINPIFFLRVKVREKLVKEESARSSPELTSESLTQRRQQPGPAHFLSIQSESSAFDRVTSKAVGSLRPSRSCVLPADPVHAIKLVTMDTPESASECSWVEPATPNVIKSSTLKIIESGPRDAPILHVCESRTEDVLSPESPERSPKSLLASEDDRLVRGHEDYSGNDDLEKPTTHSITVEPEMEQQVQPLSTQRTGRSEMVLYVQSGPVFQDATLTSHTKEASLKKRKVLARSLSDYTGPPRLQAPRHKDTAPKQELELQGSRAEGPGAEASMLDTRVSVAQLRNVFLQSARASKKPEL